MKRRTFFKAIGSVVASVAAAAYCPVVLGEVADATSPFFSPGVIERAVTGPWAIGALYMCGNDAVYQLQPDGEWKSITLKLKEWE